MSSVARLSPENTTPSVTVLPADTGDAPNSCFSSFMGYLARIRCSSIAVLSNRRPESYESQSPYSILSEQEELEEYSNNHMKETVLAQRMA
jgi:hypothetical protein